MDIKAEITGPIKYTPLMCREVETVTVSELANALAKKGVFILEIDRKTQFAVTWWVSPKRTRSYPFARVYDSLGFSGKKLTIIPVWKDEGKDGDNDYIQWDSVSSMSLLNVYVVIAYYADAQRSSRYKNKITKQRFDIEYVRTKIDELVTCHSSALHWNMEQLEQVGCVADEALASYMRISSKLGVEMHSPSHAAKRVELLHRQLHEFMDFSRDGSRKAQSREMLTLQPKEYLEGNKATITIKNFLGGLFYLTADEAEIKGENLYLYECKHSRNTKMPSLNDIKEGLLKMILFTNLRNVQVEGKQYHPIAILKLTTKDELDVGTLSQKHAQRLGLLRKEAEMNNFEIRISSQHGCD